VLDIEYINHKYYTKDKLKHILKNPNNFEEVFEEIQNKRKANAKKLQLENECDSYLWYNITDKTKENISKIKQLGRNKIEHAIPNKYKGEALQETLIDEALGSSSIEGAYSTRRQAKEMIDNNLNPLNKSQMMIKNNYKGLLFILESINQEVNKDYTVKLWKILTDETLDEEDITDGYRTDRVFVQKAITGEKIHEGISYELLESKMSKLYDYANDYTKDESLIKACIIQYYFLEVHPFFDGNGRTARALMNKFLIHQGFTFFKYFSISKILSEKRSQYYKAIEDCQEHGGDLTYFIDFYIELMVDTLVSIKETYLSHYIPIIIFDLLKDSFIELNSRQEEGVRFFFKTKKLYIDNKIYQKKFDITQETARKDLSRLNELGLITQKKKGKKYVYRRNSLLEIMHFLERL